MASLVCEENRGQLSKVSCFSPPTMGSGERTHHVGHRRATELPHPTRTLNPKSKCHTLGSSHTFAVTLKPRHHANTHHAATPPGRHATRPPGRHSASLPAGPPADKPHSLTEKSPHSQLHTKQPFLVSVSVFVPVRIPGIKWTYHTQSSWCLSDRHPQRLSSSSSALAD